MTDLTPNDLPVPEPLSPAAQAVLDAVVSQPTYATRKRIAAALCAIADQVVPEESEPSDRSTELLKKLAQKNEPKKP
jgi:hypothetical protein